MEDVVGRGHHGADIHPFQLLWKSAVEMLSGTIVLQLVPESAV